MGDWIKENKFEAGLLLVVLLLVIGAFVLGSGQGKKYREHKNYYDAAVGQKKNLEAKRPYPSRENQNEYTGIVDNYRKVIGDLETALVKFRPKEFKSIEPAEFTEKLNAAITAATNTYKDARIEFPEKWKLGFETYTATPPKKDATAYLSYQLDSASWLFGALAESRPSALINVYRAELPVEKGQSMDGGESATPTRGKPRRTRPSKSGGASSKPFYVLPLELTFRASEPSMREFLGKISSSSDHFFVIRSLRIQNEKRDKTPKRDDVEFKDGDDGAFGETFDLVVPDEGEPVPDGEEPAGDEEPLFPEDEPAAAPDLGGGERILGQVLGAEELFVFLELELVLFKAPQEEAEADVAGNP